jgi:hypothetical protein
MPIEIVSPAYHFCCSGRRKRFCFHSGEGSTPSASPSMSMPVRAPKPKGARKRAIASMPRSLESM